MDQNDLKKFERLMMDSFAELDSERKNALKARVMNSVSLASTEDFLVNESAHVAIDPQAKARVKLAVYEKLGKKPQPFWRSFFKIGSYAAPVLMTVFLGVYVLMLDNILFDSNVASATLLTQVEGEVYVLRDGHKLPAYRYMVLKEQDVVETRKGAKVEIKYLDDSLSRLNEESEVVMKKLPAVVKEKVESADVEVEIVKGGVWNRVVRRENEGAEFKVKTEKIAAKVNSTAAFTIATDDGGDVEVQVIEKSVEIASVDESEEVGQQIINEGFVAVVDQDGEEEIVIAETETMVEDEEKKWIAENVEKDTQYLQEIDPEKANELIAATTNESLSFEIEEFQFGETVEKVEIAVDQFVTPKVNPTVKVVSDKSKLQPEVATVPAVLVQEDGIEIQNNLNDVVQAQSFVLDDLFDTVPVSESFLLEADVLDQEEELIELDSVLEEPTAEDESDSESSEMPEFLQTTN